MSVRPRLGPPYITMKFILFLVVTLPLIFLISTIFIKEENKSQSIVFIRKSIKDNNAILVDDNLYRYQFVFDKDLLDWWDKIELYKSYSVYLQYPPLKTHDNIRLIWDIQK